MYKELVYNVLMILFSHKIKIDVLELEISVFHNNLTHKKN